MAPSTHLHQQSIVLISRIKVRTITHLWTIPRIRHTQATQVEITLLSIIKELAERVTWMEASRRVNLLRAPSEVFPRIRGCKWMELRLAQMETVQLRGFNLRCRRIHLYQWPHIKFKEYSEETLHSLHQWHLQCIL